MWDRGSSDVPSAIQEDLPIVCRVDLIEDHKQIGSLDHFIYVDDAQQPYHVREASRTREIFGVRSHPFLDYDRCSRQQSRFYGLDSFRRPPDAGKIRFTLGRARCRSIRRSVRTRSRSEEAAIFSECVKGRIDDADIEMRRLCRLNCGGLWRGVVSKDRNRDLVRSRR